MFQSERQTAGEAFIPYLRRDLVEMCLADGRLSPDEQEEFRELCELLAASVHFDFLTRVDAVKEHYAPFDPDRETLFPDEGSRANGRSAEEVLSLFRDLAERANYFEVEETDIRRCFDASTLIDLRTKVNLADFDRILCFARGDAFKETEVKKWFFFRRNVRVDILRRVLLLLHYRDAEYFEAEGTRGLRGHVEPFVPGKIYLFLYKDVPKFDLELLFPNVEVGMNFKDRIMFGIPAVGGAFAVLFKTLPQLLIIAGVVLFFSAGPAWAHKLGVNEEEVAGFMPVLTALLGVTMALGGLAFKQWSNYRKKRFQFLKDVSEQLFFRNLATNRSVFHRVVDSAQEEECKEMILVLYHLLIQPEGDELDRDALDGHIEAWMKEHFGTVIDFDIEGACGNLTGGQEGPMPCTGGLVSEGSGGNLRAVPLKKAKRILDQRWDRIFNYSEPPVAG